LNYELTKSDLKKLKCDMLVLTRYEGQKPSGNFKKINDFLDGKLENKVESKKFDGGFGKTVSFDTFGKIPANSIMVFGLGKKKDFKPDRIFRAGAIISRSIEDDIINVALDFQLGNNKWYLSSLIEGLHTGDYKFNKYKTENNKEKEEKNFLIVVKNKKSRQFQYEIKYAGYLSAAVSNTRDMVNEPPVYLTPSKLAEIAGDIAEEGGLDIDILDYDRIQQNKMGGIMAVTSGSEQSPKFIHLTYTPGGKAKKEIAIVGKGITFDSGGLCIKPADGMRNMKMDMAGAATVLGVMQAISHLKPAVKIHGIVPTAENMTGGDAYKPDDIITAMNGKTIEVINTDAEGRLILADALSYCSGIKPDEIIDLATLTGACIVALGNTIAGIMGNNQEMIKRIEDMAKDVGEKIWQLPLDEDIKKELESDVADIKNAGSRAGGAIYAAHFLENFVPKDTQWSHLDIAGPAFFMKANNWHSQGGSGFGVRTLVRYLTDL